MILVLLMMMWWWWWWWWWRWKWRWRRWWRRWWWCCWWWWWCDDNDNDNDDDDDGDGDDDDDDDPNETCQFCDKISNLIWVCAVLGPGTRLYILVGGFNPSERYYNQLGLLFPIYGKNHVPNHQTEYIWYIWYIWYIYGVYIYTYIYIYGPSKIPTVFFWCLIINHFHFTEDLPEGSHRKW